jgi:hypothetical protein
MRHAREPTYSFVILTLVLILINTALAWIAGKFVPAGTGGISLVCIAIAFMILFTLWFGAYGAIAAYVGTLLGGVLAVESLQHHPEIAIIWAVAGLLQVLIPLVAVRTLEVDLRLRNRRDWTIILLFAVLINNLVGSAWGAFTLSLLGPLNIAVAFSALVIGSVIITLLVVPLALRLFTERVSRSKLFVKKYWD